jgi:hypothetical protein
MVDNLCCDKGKLGQSQGRKATGPRFLGDVFYAAMQDPKTAGLPRHPLFLFQIARHLAGGNQSELEHTDFYDYGSRLVLNTSAR